MNRSSEGRYSMDDLVSENEQLREENRALKKEIDSEKQQIYELKRSLQTSQSAQEYLSAELETIQSSKEGERRQLAQKHSHELEELRSEYRDLNSGLESRCEAYEKELKSLKDIIKEMEDHEISTEKIIPKDDKIEEELRSKVEVLTNFIDELETELSALKSDQEDLKRQVEVFKEKVECQEEILQTKKEEIETKNDLIDNLQESLQEANFELMQLRKKPEEEDHNRKGNSLFAEVDDQRQKVVGILDLQNKSYKNMKQAYRQSQSEIRRLKSENAVMVAEIEKCKSIFLNADYKYKEQLTLRNRDLLRDTEKLEKKIRFLENQLENTNLGNFLEYCRNETEDLRSELKQCRLQKCELSEALQISQEELSKWRFQCLKQKCILIDRETLLEDNKIEFEQRNNIPVMDSVQVDIEDLKPEEIKREIPEIKENSLIEVESPKKLNIQENIEESIEETSTTPSRIVSESIPNPRPLDISVELIETDIISNLVDLTIPSEITREFTPPTEMSPQKQSPPQECDNEFDEKENFATLNYQPINQKSILVKQRPLTSFMDNHKKVMFSPEIAEVKTEDCKDEVKPIVNPQRSKSKLVVKHITIKSRKTEK